MNFPTTRVLMLRVWALLPGAAPPAEVFTYRVGEAGDRVIAIAVDAGGNSYLVGARSTFDRVPYPVTDNAFQKAPAAMFVAKVDARGDAVRWASYLGGRLDPSGSRFLYSTLIGGTTGSTTITSMALDPAGAAYVAGATRASDYPVRGAYQRTLNGGEDYVLTKISPAAALLASTFVGGDTDETATGMVVPHVFVDLAGRATLVGATAALSGVADDLQHPDIPLWRSDDDGRSWTASSAGLRTSAWTFERDRTWYLGAIDGVYRSVDGARTWARVMTGERGESRETFALATDPAHPGTVFAGTRSGTYKTQDRGQTWTQIDAQAVFGGPYHPATHAALIVDGNGTVFLGTDGIRRSADGGRTWTNSSQGLEPGPTNHYGSVGPIVFDPNTPGTIYVLHRSRPYRSRDGGGSWTRLDTAYPPGSPYGIRDFYGISVPPGRPGRLFASGWTEVLRSDNDGGDWRTLTDRQLYRARFLVSPARPETMYAFDGWAGPPLLVSYDAGETWMATTVPISDQRVFAVDPLQPGTLFAPAGIRTLPLLMTFDAETRRVAYASFLDPSPPSAATLDLVGHVYLVRTQDARPVLVKLQLP